MRTPIPFVSQAASPELAEALFSNAEDPKIDKNWRNSGALSVEEYAFWVRNICGIACLATILKAEKHEDIKLIPAAKEAMEFGAYKPNNEGGIDGLFYEPFTKYVKARFGLNAEVTKTGLNSSEIRKRLEQGQYIIASVSPKIRFAKRDRNLVPQSTGGHLVLITLVDEENIYYHDPAGIYEESQENAFLSLSRFDGFFAGRGIAIIP